MKEIKKLLSVLLVLFSFSVIHTNGYAENNNTSFSGNDLTGTWVMTGIEANDLIEVYITKERSEKMDNSGKSGSGTSEKITVPLKKILQNELSIGNTKFIFNNSTFDFYRKNGLTFSGNWTLSEDELTLKFKSSGSENIKHNKILKLSEKILVMESESYNKKVIFTFNKK